MCAVKIINGIKFFHDELELTQDIIEQLEDFSQSNEAQDKAYSIYIDDGELVIW